MSRIWRYLTLHYEGIDFRLWPTNPGPQKWTVGGPQFNQDQEVLQRVVSTIKLYGDGQYADLSIQEFLQKMLGPVTIQEEQFEEMV